MIHSRRPTPGRRTAQPGALVGAILLIGMAGCIPPADRRPAWVADRSLPWKTWIAGRSVEGRSLECYELGDGPDVVLLMASIHGNEPAGTPLLQELYDYLPRHPRLFAGRRVVLLPIANPDGYARGQRHNAHGVDLNRNFPASNWTSSNGHGGTALSEPESRALYELLQRHRPRRIVSIHQPLVCIDYDGPGEELARAMSATCDLPVKKLGGRPGSLGSYAGDTLGIPIITVEFDAGATWLDGPTLWSRYGRMLLTAISFPQSPP